MIGSFLRLTSWLLIGTCLLIAAVNHIAETVSGDVFLYLTPLRDREHHSLIYVFDTRTGVAQIILNQADILNFTASPDGKWLLYSRRENQATSFYLLDIMSGKKKLLVSGNIDSPRWSPDGQWIAFRQNQQPEIVLYVIAVDGGKEQALTSNLHGIFAWTSDSQSLIYAEKLEADWGVFAVSVRGKLQELLEIFEGTLINIDGLSETIRARLFVSPQHYDFTSGEYETASERMVFSGEPIWSPEHERLAFVSVSRDLRDWGLSVYSPEGDFLALYHPKGLTVSSELVWWLSGK